MGIKIFYPESRALFLHALRDQRVEFYLQQLKNLSMETYAHSVRVGLFLDLGYDFGLDPYSLTSLGFGLLLHDVGKILIPDKILHKKGSLTDEERKVIREHPRLGFLLLQDFDSLVREAVVAHHEYQKNPCPRSGGDKRKIAEDYERRVFCHETSCLAQIIAVADKYDALVHARAYKRGFSLDETLYQLRNEFTGDKKYIEGVIQRVL